MVFIMGSMNSFVGVWCSDTQSLLKMLFVCSVFTIWLSRNLSCVDEKAPGVVVGPREDRLGENPWSNELRDHLQLISS